MFFSAPETIPPLVLGALLITGFVAAWTDWTSWRIPNALVAGSAMAAIMFAVFGFSRMNLWGCILGGLIGFGLFIPLYALKGMAAGDVKLMAVVGMHVGPLMVIDIVLVTCLIGGAWAITLISMRRGTGPLFWLITRLGSMMPLSTKPKIENKHRYHKDRLTMIPYGVVIALGTLGVIGLSQR